MKYTFFLLLSVALVSAVLAAPGGEGGAKSAEYDSPRTEEANFHGKLVARSADLKPRLAYLPLIPAWGAMTAVGKKWKQQRNNGRPRRRDLKYNYDA